MNFSSALTWVPACPFVSSYAAQGLSEMYEILAEFLGRVVEVQARATAATDEEQLQRIDEELFTYPAWIDERLLALQEAGERLCAAASEERRWRDASIKSQLEESERLSNSGNLHDACQLLESRSGSLDNAPAPPRGVEPRQLQFMIWTELHKLYLRMLDQQQVVLYAAKLHVLLSHMLGKHSVSTLSSSYGFATSISRLGMGNTTARDILLAGSEGARAVFGPDSNPTGIFYGRLGREMAVLGEVDGIPQMFRALGILENHLNKENTSDFKELADDIWEILRSQAKLEDARSLSFRVSESCEQKLGSEHIMTCKYLGDLGFINLSLGNAAEAEAVLLRALTRLERTVGSEHPETLRAMSNLASVYRSRLRLEDSIRLCRRILAIRESTIGPKSWGTLLCMSNLGCSLREFGAVEEAKSVLMEAKRRLEDLPTVFEDIVDLVSLTLRGLEDESDVEASILRAEGRLRAINLTDISLLTEREAGCIRDLISLYAENDRLDDAYRLAKRVEKARVFYDEEGKRTWDFSEVLCGILEQMPEREDELVETCRGTLGKLDIESDKWKPIFVRREMTLGKALLRAGQEEEGVRRLRGGMDRAQHLDEQSRAWYREGFLHLFRHYTHSMLAGNNVDSSSKPPEFWDRVVKLLGPERDVDVS
ncbi:hypothetical protein DL768_000510 [Monosporascus sp. mg162]|nr:hypothetical protein DL768_000510 [Monosporascus sp. mg162]